MATRGGDGGVGPGEAGVFDERETSEVVASLIANLQGLVKTEIELAKLEITGIVRDKLVAVALVLVGAVFGLFVLGFVGVTAANALMLVVEAWLAWLIVTGIYLLIMLIALLVALKLLKKPSAPERTKAEMQTTKDWAKQQVKP